MVAEGFEGSLQHIFAELERVDLFVRVQVARLRQSKREDKFEGLYVSDQEIDEHLQRPIGLPRWASVVSPAEGERRLRLRDLQQQLVARREASRAAGVRLRLEDLVKSFGLTELDRNVLLLCLAPELEPRYERIFAYLQDDVTRRRPSVHLMLEMICLSLADKLDARARFDPDAPLLRHGLVELFDDPAHPQPTLLGRYLRLDPRIAAFLLDSDAPPAELSGLIELRRCDAGSLEWPPAPAAMMRTIASSYDPREGLCVNIVGPRGDDKKSWAQALCAALELDLVVVRLQPLLAGVTQAEALRRLRAIGRETILQRAAIYWDGVDALGEDEHAAVIQALLDRERRGLALLASSRPWSPAERAQGLPFVRVELPTAGYAERIALWRQELGGDLASALTDELPALATKFRFSAGQIQAVAASVRAQARWRPDGSSPGVTDVYAACRAQSSRRLGELARSIRPRYTWNDIVLSNDSLGQLREICERVRLRGRVLEEWGFDAKLSLGKGLNVLFSGPSGTGKTMAAEILAHELGLELYKIDLSGIVSKYIGETEKNLSRIFAEAETSNAILFFDEADSLFGKRSEVKDAHDRYANIETAYLLQRMEEYEGLTILATNLRKNLDEAFLRRMGFAVAFALPEEGERLDIWRKVWPRETPIESSLDLPFMARQFKLSGANIKNIALAAAFLAASREVPVSIAHLLAATRRELQKLGRMCVPADFGPYAALVE